MTACQKLIRILLINRQTLALSVRAAVTANFRAFIWHDISRSQGTLNKIYRISYITLLVGILDTKQKIAVISLRKQVAI